MTVVDEGRIEKAQRAAAEKLSGLVGKVVDDGVGPVLGSKAYADDRLERARRDGRTAAEAVEAAIKAIIRESVAAAGTTGFVTGLGGLLALPVTLPANVAGNLAINARMVGAIAHLRGYPLSDPHTRTVVLLTVAGSNLQSAASSVGVKLGTQRSAVTLARAIPVAGGLVGGSVDATLTGLIGKGAKKAFARPQG